MSICYSIDLVSLLIAYSLIISGMIQIDLETHH